MIKRALKLYNRIIIFLDKNENEIHGTTKKKAQQTDEEKEHLLVNDKLKEDDWLALAKIMKILEMFYKLTKRSEGTKLQSDRSVLSDYLLTLNILIDHIR
jgi:hypothetical protein